MCFKLIPVEMIQNFVNAVITTKSRLGSQACMGEEKQKHKSLISIRFMENSEPTISGVTSPNSEVAET